MIEIGNIPQFKQGVFDICKLFKTMFQNDRNIIISKDNVNYINNIDQLFSLKTANNTTYNFATNYTLTQIQNFRENICINPILYIIAFEQLVEEMTSFRGLEKYNFKKVVDFLKWYYENSNLAKAIIKKEHIKRLFFKEYQDDFLAKIIDMVSEPKNVEIIESKTNTLVEHKYYKLPAHYLSGLLYGQDYKIFITNTLSKELFVKLVNLNIPILVVCNDVQFEVTNSYNLTICTITPTEMIKHYECLCLFTGFGRGYQNLNEWELNNYSFGEIKDFKLIDGKLHIASKKSLSEDEVKGFNKKDTLDKYYALQGKNLTINCTEEYLERVRCIVSTIKSIQNSGIFYTEPKALKIISRALPQDVVLQSYVNKLLKSYLQLFHFDYNKIEEVIDNGDLSASFNVYTGKYDDEIFTPLDYYLNIFALLDSNVKTLGKLGIG